MLTAKSLAILRDERYLFTELSFTVQAGDILQIEGPNGSGKTTLLRILAGLVRDHEGDISWCNTPLQKCWENYCKAMSYIGHAASVKPQLTAQENLHWLVGLKQTVNKNQINQALAQMGLRGQEDIILRNLSAGQKRRVLLSRLLLETSKLWLLDEPFTAIDKPGVELLQQLIVKHCEQGGAVILTSHQDLTLRYAQFNRLHIREFAA
jgi:heme exporter protein A